MPQNNLSQNQSQIIASSAAHVCPAIQSYTSIEGLMNIPQMEQSLPKYILQQNVGVEPQKSSCPVVAKCPQCNQISKTSVTSQAGKGTLACSFVLCLFTNLCCIPFWVNSCKDNVHTCSNCKTVVGINKYSVF